MHRLVSRRVTNPSTLSKIRCQKLSNRTIVSWNDFSKAAEDAKKTAEYAAETVKTA